MKEPVKELLLRVTRQPSKHKSTIGALHWSVDAGKTWTYLCFTLEDEIREVPDVPVEQWKVAGQTAIPQGKYKVIVDYSMRFKRGLPRVLNVPGFEGIRIHGGNGPENTEGCLLVAYRKLRDDFIQGTAIGNVMMLLAENGSKATIQYINPAPSLTATA